MIIDGKDVPNITCPRCRHRHPAVITCEQAKRQAEVNAMKRAETHTRRVSESYSQALDQYNLAIEQVDARCGEGVSIAIITLMESWKKLGEANGV